MFLITWMTLSGGFFNRSISENSLSVIICIWHFKICEFWNHVSGIVVLRGRGHLRTVPCYCFSLIFLGNLYSDRKSNTNGNPGDGNPRVGRWRKRSPNVNAAVIRVVLIPGAWRLSMHQSQPCVSRGEPTGINLEPEVKVWVPNPPPHGHNKHHRCVHSPKYKLELNQS